MSPRNAGPGCMLLELIEQPLATVVRRQFALDDIERIGILLQRQREQRILTIHQHAVPVDPALLGVLDVVVHNKDIDRGDQLEITDVRQEIRLHDGQLHVVASLGAITHFDSSRLPADEPADFINDTQGKIRINWQTQHLPRRFGRMRQVVTVGRRQPTVHREL